MKKIILILFCGLIFAANFPLRAEKVESEKAQQLAYMSMLRGHVRPYFVGAWSYTFQLNINILKEE
jgi:hypothetical protein